VLQGVVRQQRRAHTGSVRPRARSASSASLERRSGSHLGEGEQAEAAIPGGHAQQRSAVPKASNSGGGRPRGVTCWEAGQRPPPFFGGVSGAHKCVWPPPPTPPRLPAPGLCTFLPPPPAAVMSAMPTHGTASPAPKPPGARYKGEPGLRRTCAPSSLRHPPPSCPPCQRTAPPRPPPASGCPL
jgi:hypothetical protein